MDYVSIRIGAEYLEISAGSCPISESATDSFRIWMPSVKIKDPLRGPSIGGYCHSEASRGFEPLSEGFADPCLTTWPRRLVVVMTRMRIADSTIGNPHCRAGDGIRTHDLLLGKETYYHCTTPAFPALLYARVPRHRIELWTPRFSVACSTN